MQPGSYPGGTDPHHLVAMTAESIYDELGVPTVINAASTKTRIGGSLIRPEAVEAMSRASESFVRISDLQAKASEVIAEVTGAEAGYVANGAAACLTLAAAAAIAGDDLAAMEQLPDTEGLADEIIMPNTHRNGYDHALRAAGAQLVTVGNNDNYLGTGSNSTEDWEIESAIGEDTAAIAYMEKAYTSPPLEAVVEIAHRNDIPVIVDAAAELPPAENLRTFIDLGADMVVFSGGKAIRGPQTSGILAGREEYIRSAALQHLDMHVAPEVWEPPASLIDPEKLQGVPRQGVGRPLKAGKEEIVGLITALELFVEEDQDAIGAERNERAAAIEAGLAGIDGVSTEVEPGGKIMAAPQVMVQLDPSVTPMNAVELVGTLRKEDPRIFVGSDDLLDEAFGINTMCITDDEADYIVERIRAHLA